MPVTLMTIYGNKPDHIGGHARRFIITFVYYEVDETQLTQYQIKLE